MRFFVFSSSLIFQIFTNYGGRFFSDVFYNDIPVVRSEGFLEKRSVSRRSNIACQKQQTVIYLVIYSYIFFLQHFRVEREHKSVRKNYYKAKARYQAFDPFLHARFFRLKIRAWRGHQCLTLELYGCDSCEYNFLENIKLSISLL